jgi:hypothetical protein
MEAADAMDLEEEEEESSSSSSDTPGEDDDEEEEPKTEPYSVATTLAKELRALKERPHIDEEEGGETFVTVQLHLQDRRDHATRKVDWHGIFVLPFKGLKTSSIHAHLPDYGLGMPPLCMVVVSKYHQWMSEPIPLPAEWKDGPRRVEFSYDMARTIVSADEAKKQSSTVPLIYLKGIEPEQWMAAVRITQEKGLKSRWEPVPRPFSMPFPVTKKELQLKVSATSVVTLVFPDVLPWTCTPQVLANPMQGKERVVDTRIWRVSKSAFLPDELQEEDMVQEEMEGEEEAPRPRKRARLSE